MHYFDQTVEISTHQACEIRNEAEADAVNKLLQSGACERKQTRKEYLDRTLVPASVLHSHSLISHVKRQATITRDDITDLIIDLQTSQDSLLFINRL